MKASITSKLLLLIAFMILLSCSEESPVKKNSVSLEQDEPFSKEKNNARIMAEGQYEDWDWSGQVRVLTKWKDFPGSDVEAPSGTVTMSSDYVIVGGGAYVFNTGWGAFLTKSYPDFPNNAWKAASKSHIKSDPHQIRIYAIGLKLENISATTLRSYMTSDSKISVEGSNPDISVNIPSGFVALGGGAEVVDMTPGYGHMLQSSYGSHDFWYAKSRDHMKSDPAQVKAYIIGIKSNIPGFGILEVSTNRSNPSVHVSSGICTVDQVPAFNDQGYRHVNTCVGGRTYFSLYAWGRMLTGLRPKDRPVDPVTPPGWAQSKDHINASAGYTDSHSSYLRKYPF